MRRLRAWSASVHNTSIGREVALALDLGLTLRPAFNRCRIMLRSNSEKPPRYLEEQLAGRRRRTDAQARRLREVDA
jgi:hypothetical protein